MKQQSIFIPGGEIDQPMLIHVSRVSSHVASRVTWHSHEGYEIIYLLDGATSYEFSGRPPVDLHGGQFLVVPPRLVHRGLSDVRAPCTICGLAIKMRPSLWKNTTFTQRNLRRLQRTLESSAGRAHPFNQAIAWILRRMMAEAAALGDQTRRAEAAIALRALISAVLVESMRQILVPPSEPREFVSAAVAWLRQHLQERITMKDLVRFVGYGRARMFDIFKAQTGVTPHDYLQRLRIEKAQEQLRSTQASITDVALGAGFSSGQYFSTVFARYTGVSPTRFRKGAKARRVPIPSTSTGI